MHITRLRLLGFKSFVEPAELHIERGLTGVVGPNGCGKSNLLEALRWVMGETSYKNMRASSMEDVIFSGTDARPARNIAEVTIALDNRDRKAHPAFNDDDNLEITRRIVRDSGSEYSINGKPVRARDVQLLFADASTGAHSPALVQQGRIGEIVSAKPAQRRFILEEAAGITGLHSRRHEAEIKLRGAETNLERLQDIIGQMETSLSGLQRQERQVKRYREITRELERLTVLQLYSDYLSYQTASTKAQQAHQDTLRIVGEKTSAEAELRKMHQKAGEQLPPLREREMVAAAIVQRLNIESDQLEREQQAQQDRKDELTARQAQSDSDLAREEKGVLDDQARLEEFAGELQGLEKQALENTDDRKQAADSAEKARAELSAGEREQLSLNTALAEQKAHHNALAREQDEKQNSARALEEKNQKLEEERSSLKLALSQIADFDELSSDIETARSQLVELDALLQSGQGELDDARRDDNERLHHHMECRSRLSTLDTEIATLEKLLQTPASEDDVPVLNDIEVTPGYETALGAALGDDLEASLDIKTEHFWAGIQGAGDLQDLPSGTIPLDQLVRAPKALSARLAMTGIVERGEGDERQGELLPGQRLVSVEGDLWRWDGFTARADAPTAAARRLVERNRLEELQTRLSERRRETEQAGKDFERSHEKLLHSENLHKERASQHTQLRLGLDEKLRKMTAAEQRASDHKARFEAITATKTELAERILLERARAEQVEQELTQLPDLAVLENGVSEHATLIEVLRATYHEAKARFDGLEHAEQARIQRIATLKSEVARTADRVKQAQSHMKTLTTRQEKDVLELTNLADLPEQINAKRQALNSELQKAAEQRTRAADELQQAENTLREIEASLRDMQGEAASAREQRAGCEARLEAAKTRLEEQHQLIASELDCAPDDCPQKAGLENLDELPERTELEHQLAKLTQNRERLGQVNLRADIEARELATQIEEMSLEHKDLIDAIDALRTAISGLNREGRRRLMSAFHEINGHFESLFTSLFGGGKARLELIESDDPLQAGLEIIASPPGKKPQVLTLLSGGEKALTALSLIFAVFLTNPAPICVLDEVDAPLDDANVERFCTLLNEMTKKTDTRFLVITHHPTTMSQMDRLFGVTMAEKGISQMVSVDLSTAESYRETA